MLALAVWLASAGAVAAQRPKSQQLVVSLDSLLEIEISGAAKYAQTVRQAPSSVTIVTAEDIARYGHRTLEDVLKTVRGFYTSNDRNYTYIGVRGFSRPTDYNNRVLLLVNGHPLNETFYGFAPFGTDLGIEMSGVERIEVIRGPGSSVYGGNAMLAVVNVITRTGLNVNGVEATLKGGTAGYVEGGLVAGMRKGRADLFVSGQVARSDGSDLYFREFDDGGERGGRVSGLDWDEWAGALVVAQLGDLRVQARASRREKGVPTGSWGSSFGDPDETTLDRWAMLEAMWSRRIHSRLEATARAHTNYYAYDAVYPADQRWTDMNRGAWSGGELRLVADAAPNYRLVVGADGVWTTLARYRYELDGVENYDGDFPYYTVAAYATNEVSIGSWLTVEAGARMDGSSFARSALSPRFAVIATPRPRSTVKLLAGEAFRPPSVYEREYEADGHKRVPGLDPERVWTWELAWNERLSDHVAATVAGYRSHITGLIDTYVDAADDQEFVANREHVHASALELQLDGTFDGGATAYLSYGYTRTSSHAHAQAPEAGAMSNSPVHSVKAGATSPVAGHAMVGVAGRFEDRRRTVQGTVTERAVIVDVRIGTLPVLRGLSAELKVGNILDRAWSTPGGYEHVPAMIPQDGRTLRAGLSYRF